MAPLEHGWLHAGNEALLTRLLREREPRVVVELGSWLGLCMGVMLEAAPSSTVLAVDLWDGAQLLRSQREQYEHDEPAMRILREAPLPPEHPARASRLSIPPQQRA